MLTPYLTDRHMAEIQLLSVESAQVVFEQAHKAIRLRRYAEAIPLFEQFCDQTDESYSNHYQAKMLLVKAYQHHQEIEKAIALCQELLEVNHTVTQIWARNYLPMIAPEIARSMLEQPEKPEIQEEKDPNLPKRSLEEFKDFCRQQLIADLRNVEKERKEVLLPLGISTAVFIVLIGLILNFVSFNVQSRIAIDEKYCSQMQEIVEKEKLNKQNTNLNEQQNIHSKRGAIVIPLGPEVLAELRSQEARVKAREQAQAREIVERCESDFRPKWKRFATQILTVALLVIKVLFFLWIALYTSSTEAYGQGFRRNIIEKIIKFLDPERNLNYLRIGDDVAVLSVLQRSHLFSGINQSVYLKQDHCVAGKIGETDLHFSELVLQKELPQSWINLIFQFVCSYGRQGGSLSAMFALLLLSVMRGLPYCIGRMMKGQRIDFEHFRSEIILNDVSRQAVFKGLFFTSDFNRKFIGRTVILPKNLTSELKFLNQHRGQSVKLEDPEFNKLFSVYSNDQVGARYVLSTSVMQRIVEFRKKANRDLLIALVDSQLYIAVPSEEDLFEPRLFKTMLSFQPMREYFEMLQLMMSIVEDLNLNQRIWKR